MASKWDDDDVERPQGTVKKDVRADVEDWQAKLKKAEQSGPPKRERAPPKSTTVFHDPPPKDAPPPPPAELPAAQAERLAAEARSSADDVKRRAGGRKRVRLRVRVPGWYAGSVPAVDFNDGGSHFFPRAPSRAVETADEFNRYWRAPFIEHLKKLGLEVIEQDV